jgi:phosphopantetheinyl transferase
MVLFKSKESVLKTTGEVEIQGLLDIPQTPKRMKKIWK